MKYLITIALLLMASGAWGECDGFIESDTKEEQKVCFHRILIDNIENRVQILKTELRKLEIDRKHARAKRVAESKEKGR
jgi:hypothetical protein